MKNINEGVFELNYSFTIEGVRNKGMRVIKS